ncbi:Gibberellin cluster GA4 desaturase [Lachnellula suecica]|uniref:Gibberellin cluster GA4 desaturase n=1 Tax=Lachnellula suecica TaxID=602035 RepID=A0A8T9CM45_9HELO|nr:Gibberellin cluster GA4 desaturase [Lachnellula suecica]
MSQSTKESDRRDILADINYFAADGTTRQPGVFKKPVHGVRSEYARLMTIRNIRSIVDDFQINVNGFQFVRLPTKERDVTDVELVKNEYYQELSDTVKSITGASTVHVFNHVLRQTTDAPSGHPHVDYCGVPELLEGTKQEIPLPPHISKLYGTSSRFCYVNTWRPLKTLNRDPLALADATTVPDSDYQLRARKFPSGIESGNYIMSHGSDVEQHRWYYMPGMSPDDMVVFKGYDTKQDLPGWRCPHTAIVLERTEHLPPRESIECRATNQRCYGKTNLNFSSKPVVIVIDCVKAYHDPKSQLYAPEPFDIALKSIIRLIEKCREVGIPVIYSSMVYESPAAGGKGYTEKLPSVLCCYDTGNLFREFAEGVEPTTNEVVVLKQYSSSSLARA